MKTEKYILQGYILDAMFEKRPGVNAEIDWNTLFQKNVLRSSRWVCADMYKGMNLTILRDCANQELVALQGLLRQMKEEL
jgi:hypothetical protein